MYKLQSTPDLLNPIGWKNTGAIINGDGSYVLLFDPATFVSGMNCRVVDKQVNCREEQVFEDDALANPSPCYFV